jgi:hypothetical protein
MIRRIRVNPAEALSPHPINLIILSKKFPCLPVAVVAPWRETSERDYEPCVATSFSAR